MIYSSYYYKARGVYAQRAFCFFGFERSKQALLNTANSFFIL